MRSSSSSSASGLPAKRRKLNPITPVQKSPFTDFGSYMVAKNQKLRSQFEAKASSTALLNGESSSSGNGKGIFHGVSIFVNGHTVPSNQELREYMLRHGGRFENYFSRSRVTHIICSNLPDSKLRNLRAFSRGLPVLKPAWVVDSVAANKLLSYSPYQLVERPSETYKQQNLYAFFGCKAVSTHKDTEVASDSKEGRISEGLEKTEDANVIQENLVLDREIPNSETNELGLHKKMEITMLDEETKLEVSKFSSALHSFKTSVQVDDFPSGEPIGVKCPQVLDTHHSTLTDPNFVENYFKHSRLHFIGIWRNRYRKRFCDTLERNFSKANNFGSCSSTKKASIIHIDMDCFFVSVILRKHPKLLDKPVAVCHSNNFRGTAEISSANYPARNYGIKAGMFVRDAKACCPNLVIFPYDFGAYEEVADQFYSILHKHCDKVQAVSCDEAFLDITACDYLDPESFASMLRKEILETTQCTASAGIAKNLLMARLATKIAKPNGQYFIPLEKVENFLNDLPIMKLPGIGHNIGDKLENKKIYTCGQLRLVSKEALHKDFGVRFGDMLWNYCRGIDDRKVEVLKETKSVGADVNWGVRFNNSVDCEHFLNNLSKEVSFRLLECGVIARTVTLKIKKRKKGAKEPTKYLGCGDCENISRTVKLPVATNDATLIQRIAKQIFASYRIAAKEVRGVGLHMSRLEVMDVTNRQGFKNNVFDSWLTVPAKVADETAKLDSLRNESLTSNKEQQLLDLKNKGQLHENSPMFLDRVVAGSDKQQTTTMTPSFRSTKCDQLYDAACFDTLLINSRSHEFISSELPPVSQLDISIINDLPAEIISEMNSAYNGKLYDFLKKHNENPKNNSNTSMTPPEVLGENALKTEATKYSGGTSYKLSYPKKAETSEVAPHQVELPADSSSKLNIMEIKASAHADRMDCTPDCKNKSLLAMQNLSEVAVLYKSAPAQAVLTCSAGVAEGTLRNFSTHMDLNEYDKARINLWSGTPLNWIEKFQVSNYLILNLIAQLYIKFGSNYLLSPTLQFLISLYPIIFGSSSDESVEAQFDLCELLLHYIDLKINSDIEELFLCCHLLERLATMSNVFSQVYSIVLPLLQASVSEIYGGTLQLTESRD